MKTEAPPPPLISAKRTTLSPQGLVQQHFMDVYAVCFRHLGHPQDAEDATQETFAVLFRDWEKASRAASPKAWLLTVARNTAISYFRKRVRVRPMSLEPEETSPIGESFDRERLHRALAALTPKDRELIETRFLQRRSEPATGAARTGLCRALKRLRSLYHEGDL